jgi:hypothetical protein
VTSPRVTSQVLVSSLLRRVQAEGGFGAVLAKGDETAGAVLVILTRRGVRCAVLERLLQSDGAYAWQDNGRAAGEDEAAFRAWLDRRRRAEPDLWLIELDVADAERFAAEMNATG